MQLHQISTSLEPWEFEIEILTSIFDLGLSKGTGELNSTQVVAFYIQDLRLQLDMGGLDGYLYNNLEKGNVITDTIDAFRTAGGIETANILENVVSLFDKVDLDHDGDKTWGEVCEQHDPDNLIHSEWDRLTESAYEPAIQRYLFQNREILTRESNSD